MTAGFLILLERPEVSGSPSAGGWPGSETATMDSLGSVTRLIHDLRHDDPAVRDRAARLVWEHYFRDLLALAAII